jgi:nucleotide-binding universal stress UspA family protein
MPGIIAGIDNSSHSRAVLEWAMLEAAVRRAPLTVITVEPIASSGWGGMIAYPADSILQEQAQKTAQKVVDEAAERLGGAAPSSITVRALVGLPAVDLIDASKDADLLVVGSRGAGGFARLMLGSVSSQVAHHAHCPVVIIPASRHQ